MVRSRDSPEFTHNPQDVCLCSPPAVCFSSSSGRLFCVSGQKRPQHYFSFDKEVITLYEFFTSAIDTLQILVVALGAGLGAWGVINLLEGYSNDNPGDNAHVP